MIVESVSAYLKTFLIIPLCTTASQQAMYEAPTFVSVLSVIDWHFRHLAAFTSKLVVRISPDSSSFLREVKQIFSSLKDDIVRMFCNELLHLRYVLCWQTCAHL